MTDPHIPTIVELTPALLAAIVGAIASLIFRYVPWFSDWLDEQSPTHKQTFMLVLTLFIGLTIGVWNFARAGVDEASVVTLALSIFGALTANQTTYQFVKWHPAQTDIPAIYRFRHDDQQRAYSPPK